MTACCQLVYRRVSKAHIHTLAKVLQTVLQVCRILRTPRGSSRLPARTPVRSVSYRPDEQDMAGVRTLTCSALLSFLSNFFCANSALSAFLAACDSLAHLSIQVAHQPCNTIAPAHIHATVRTGSSVRACMMSRSGFGFEAEKSH